MAPPARAADPDSMKLASFAAPSACKHRGTEAAGARYEFDHDWFKPNIPVWTRLLGPLKDRPARYLEVGVFEGRSLLFVLDNILKHPDSQAVAIDIHIGERYLRNVARSGACAKVRNYQGPSQSVMKYLPAKSFDVIYVDGAHTAQAVLADAVLAFELLKDGGLLIFDDYQWKPQVADDLRPQVAIDAFVTAFRHQLTLEHRAHQLAVRKHPNPCADAPPGSPAGDYLASPVGRYCYDWWSGTLSRRDGQRVWISREEKRVVEAIARLPRFGEIDGAPDAKLREDPIFQSLNSRLRLVP